MLEEHARTAYLVFKSHCKLFKSIGSSGINIWDVDVQRKPRGLGSHDLVACSVDFEGWMSVEIETRDKLCMRLSKQDALTKFQQLGPSPNFTRLLLLVHHVKPSSQELCLKAHLWDGSWKSLGEFDFEISRPVLRRPPVKEALAAITWYPQPGGQPIAALSDLARKAGYKSTHDLWKQVPGWNGTLRLNEHGRLLKKKVPRRPGSKAWVGTWAQFKCIYPYM